MDYPAQAAPDRITQILQDKAAASRPMPLPNPQLASAESIQPGEQQIRPLDMLKMKIAQGDPQANQLAKRVQMFTGNDPQAQDSALQFMIDHPQEIDPSNSYQVGTAMAQWSKQSGFNDQHLAPQQPNQPQGMQIPQAALQMPSPQDISMQDLAGIASGRGTNYQGLQQGAAQDIGKLQLEMSKAAMLGRGGTTAFAMAMNAINSDPQLAGLPMETKLRLAQNKVGENLTIDPTTKQVVAMQGAPQALGNLKFGENTGGEAGTQQQKLKYAAPIAAETARGGAETEALKNEQTTNSKADLMIQNSQDMINQAQQLLNEHPVIGASAPLLKGAAAAQGAIPGAGKDIVNTVTSLKQLGSANLLPSIKEYLQGTGQVRVFEGINLDKIFSYDEEIPLSANIQKWNNAINQVQMGAAGAKALRQAVQGNQVVPTGISQQPQAGVPAGAVPTGKTIGGKPVYKLPNGKGWIPD